MKLIAWNRISIGSTGSDIAHDAALAAAARVVRRGGFCDGGGSSKAPFVSNQPATTTVHQPQRKRPLVICRGAASA